MYSGPLYITSDHAGYKLKKRLVRYLKNELKFEMVHPLLKIDDNDRMVLYLSSNLRLERK